MELQVGVKALLKNKEGKFLLLHPSSAKYQGVKGLWDIVGERIKLGATFLENPKREIREETSLELKKSHGFKRLKILFVSRKNMWFVLLILAKLRGSQYWILTKNDKFVWLSLGELSKQEDLDIYHLELFEKEYIDIS